MDATDLELLGRARGGDDQAFGLLVDRHAQRLHRLAVGLVGNAADAEDLVQETFKGAFLGLGKFRGQASVKTWLTRILLRQAARHYRQSRWRRRFVSLSHAGEGSESPGPVDLALEVGPGTPAAEARLDVAVLLARLSPEHREVIAMRELQGLTYLEMAEALSVPPGTIESRLFRARRALCGLLGGDQSPQRGERRKTLPEGS